MLRQQFCISFFYNVGLWRKSFFEAAVEFLAAILNHHWKNWMQDRALSSYPVLWYILGFPSIHWFYSTGIYEMGAIWPHHYIFSLITAPLCLYIFTFCFLWLLQTSNIRKTFLSCSVITDVQNYINAPLRISVRGRECRHIPSWGPPSGHWSSGTAQTSTNHSTATLKGSPW